MFSHERATCPFPEPDTSNPQTIGLDRPSRTTRYLLPHNVQPGFGAHPGSYLIDTGFLSLGKEAGGVDLTTHPALE
jgi:hypothetical protein